MRRKSFRLTRWAAPGLLALALSLPALAQTGSGKDSPKAKQAKSDQDRTTQLKIHVLGGDKKEPVDNASVYLKFQEPGALHFLLHHDKKVELDLKTDLRGFASFPELPRGKLLIQIVAPGWQTFGQYYTLDKDFQTIEVVLQHPKTRWY